ncbi:MAG TPA: phosphatidylcholine/phosphatidylserine synthase [Mizugakiibacter sp.]|nr:phosphatidylcholine/phosphatidylserine synthase [Mizugakiibacter sp.]
MNELPTRCTSSRRGIYLLPNLFTTGAMFAGFYAIVAAIDGYFAHAVVAVFVAAILDGLDGRIARLTHTQSEFGVQYDSLSDLVSFGLAPSLVLYTWSLADLHHYGPVWGKIGWTAAFLYTACAALRLARFNTQVGVIDKRYFQGLASPAAAGLVMSYVWAASSLGFSGGTLVFLTLALIVPTGLLMVSRFRYISFKAWPVGEKVPFLAILVVVLVLVALTIDPPRVLFVVFLLYVLSGPVWTIWVRATHRRRRRGTRA